MNKMSNYIIFAIASLVLLAIAPQAIVYASAPSEGAYFNNPLGSNSQRDKIFNIIVEAIESSKPGSKIMISTYLFDSPRATQALVDAHRRDVSVRLIADRKIHNKQLSRLINEFKNNDKSKYGNSEVIRCKYSCLGKGRGSNHTKFYAFSHTGEVRNVVIFSSGNLNNGSRGSGWNDARVHHGKAHFQAIERIYRLMRRDKPAFVTPLRLGSTTVHVYPKKGLKPGNDVLMKELRNTSCKGRTPIWANIFHIDDELGRKVAKKLIERGRANCDVRVVAGAPSKVIHRMFVKAARNGHIKYFDSRQIKPGSDLKNSLRTHSKYLIIAEGPKSRVIYGSRNWAATRGDEIVVVERNKSITDGYMSNWRNVASASKRK